MSVARCYRFAACFRDRWAGPVALKPAHPAGAARLEQIGDRGESAVWGSNPTPTAGRSPLRSLVSEKEAFRMTNVWPASAGPHRSIHEPTANVLCRNSRPNRGALGCAGRPGDAEAKERILNGVLLPLVTVLRRLHTDNMGIREREARADYLKILKAALDRRGERD